MKYIYNKANLPIIKKELTRLGGLIFKEEFQQIMKDSERQINKFIKEYNLKAKLKTEVFIIINKNALHLVRINICFWIMMDNDNYDFDYIREAISECSPDDVNDKFFLKTVLDNSLTLSKEVYRNVVLTKNFETDVNIDMNIR